VFTKKVRKFYDTLSRTILKLLGGPGFDGVKLDN